MLLIGITGGVGSGKSEALAYLQKRCRCMILKADDLANELKLPGRVCYAPLVALLGEEVLMPDGTIGREKMAGLIFADPALLQQVNALIHPAVKETVRNEVEAQRRLGRLDVCFLEAALLIEDGYEEMLDELWYIHAPEEVRRGRLKESRGYSDRKIDQILCSQLSEETFLAHATAVIENGGGRDGLYAGLDGQLKRLSLLSSDLPGHG